MCFAVDFDYQPGFRAVEVEDVWSGGDLLPYAERKFAEFAPEQDLGEGEVRLSAFASARFRLVPPSFILTSPSVSCAATSPWRGRNC